jgi:hypothetical protein
MIFGSIIGVAMNYTRRGRVSPTLGEFMGIPDPRHYLHTHMIIDDGGWPKALRDWTLAYVFYLIYLNF